MNLPMKPVDDTYRGPSETRLPEISWRSPTPDELKIIAASQGISMTSHGYYTGVASRRANLTLMESNPFGENSQSFNDFVDGWESEDERLSLTPETSYDYEMKSWPAFFSKMITGEKRHDMRDKRDRDYKVGDKALLREWDPFIGSYTGRWAVFEITYITSNESPCAMSSVALDRNVAILSVALMECLTPLESSH